MADVLWVQTRFLAEGWQDSAERVSTTAEEPLWAEVVCCPRRPWEALQVWASLLGKRGSPRACAGGRASKPNWESISRLINPLQGQPHPLQGTSMPLYWVTHQCPHSLEPEACLLILFWEQPCHQGLCLGRDGTGEIQCPRQETHSSLSHRPFPKCGMAYCPGDFLPMLAKGLFSRIVLAAVRCTVICLIFKHTSQAVSKEKSKSWKNAQLVKFWCSIFSNS